jgi:hypothetical protein
MKGSIRSLSPFWVGRGCGRIKVIASIEDPALIERILAHVRQRAEEICRACRWARAPPQPTLF